MPTRERLPLSALIDELRREELAASERSLFHVSRCHAGLGKCNFVTLCCVRGGRRVGRKRTVTSVFRLRCREGDALGVVVLVFALDLPR